MLAVAIGAAYALLVQASFWFLLKPLGSTAFYAPAGLALAVLFLTPRRTWPLWLAAFATAQMVIVAVLHHRPVVPRIGYSVADMAEPVVGALLLAAVVRRAHGERAKLVGFALLPVAAAPALSALVAGAVAVLLDPSPRSWSYVVGHWWVADALGVLVVGGLILAWSRPIPFEARASLPWLAAVALAGAGAIVASGVLWHYPLVYIVLPGLVWAAFVGGLRAVATVGAAAALAADWVALTGRAGRLLGSPRPGEQVEFLQLFLGVTFLTGLVLAVEIAERRRNEHRSVQAEQQLAASEEAAVTLAEAERHSITQDTHDIVGHGLSAMLLQLGAVRQVIRTDPDLACELVASVESIGRSACDDLDLMLNIVGGQATLTPGHGLDHLPELVVMLRRAGLQVDLRTEGERRAISTLIDWSAYRIVREALTNVVKHAPAASATVTIQYGAHVLSLWVIDDGAAADGPCTDGRGIIGMRERAAALGGTLDAAPRARGGFAVTATLPMARP